MRMAKGPRPGRVLIVTDAPSANAYRQHNYARPLADMAQRAMLAPGVHHVDIYHDDWCAIYRGGYCNCEPVVQLREPDPRMN